MKRQRKRPDKRTFEKHIEDGMNGVEIAELYNVSRTRAYKWARLYNIRFRVRRLPVHYNLTGDPMIDALRLEAQYQCLNVYELSDRTGIDYRNVARVFYERKGLSLANWQKFADALGFDEVIERVQALKEIR